MKFKRGFTLLEITIVFGIISLILTLGSNLFIFSKQIARDSVRKTDINQIRASLEFYRDQNPDKYYVANLSSLISSDGYIDKIPNDPLNSSVNYCYELNATDPTNYLLAAELERGGPSSCNCNSISYNYCYSSLGLLLTPTPSIVSPINTPTSTPPIVASPTPTSAPTSTPMPTISCHQVNIAHINDTVTMESGDPASQWSLINTLTCSRSSGTGAVFTTVCQIAGTTTVNVTNGLSSGNCPVVISP
ncbi:MAG: prepilin-type N-terminal cleavage/methylation domain-containing protein [bacterium]